MERVGERSKVRALKIPRPEAARPGPDKCPAATHTVNRNETSTANHTACTSPWIVPPHNLKSTPGGALGDAELKLMLA